MGYSWLEWITNNMTVRSVWISECLSVWSVPQMAIELGRMKCSAIEIIEFQLKKSGVPYIWETIWNLTWHVGRSLQPLTGWPEPSEPFRNAGSNRSLSLGLPAISKTYLSHQWIVFFGYRMLQEPLGISQGASNPSWGMLCLADVTLDGTTGKLGNRSKITLFIHLRLVNYCTLAALATIIGKW